MIVHMIVCANCGSDPTTTGLAKDYYLVLTSHEKEDEPGDAVMGYIVSDPLPEPLHFCSRKCLTQWASSGG